MNEPRVIWNDNGFAANSGWETVHATDPATNEYSYTHDVWISIGTSLPSGAYLDAPMHPELGKAIVRENDSWLLIDDYRGQTAYCKQTGHPSVIETLGALPNTLTLSAQGSPFDVWSEHAQDWVKDDDLEYIWMVQQAQLQRQTLMSEANQEIAVLIDALDPSIIGEPSNDDHDKLIAWKTYRVTLSKIDLQPEYPYAINWPIKPH